ncbi:MAG TPA: NADH-quinone oxidoreductase subunit J [Candidatus Acidoferrales bacterium]|nr:NADH-quinone oxidoreductase subunit J [Candidatus Acidoferrales bacterium]
MANQFLFYFFAVLAVVSGVLVVTMRNAVHSAVFLITSLLATAGLYLTLNAEFLFVVQIILYVGGIMVLFVFVIMLVNLDVALHQVQFNRQTWVAGLLSMALLAELLAAVALARANPSGTGFLAAPHAQAAPTVAGNTEQIGMLLFHNYVIPFEIASILLLVALVGAVVMGKKRI